MPLSSDISACQARSVLYPPYRPVCADHDSLHRRTLTIKAHDQRSPPQGDEYFSLARVQVPVRAHVAPRLNRVQHALKQFVKLVEPHDMALARAFPARLRYRIKQAIVKRDQGVLVGLVARIGSGHAWPISRPALKT